MYRTRESVASRGFNDHGDNACRMAPYQIMHLLSEDSLHLDAEKTGEIPYYDQ